MTWNCERPLKSIVVRTRATFEISCCANNSNQLTASQINCLERCKEEPSRRESEVFVGSVID